MTLPNTPAAGGLAEVSEQDSETPANPSADEAQEQGEETQEQPAEEAAPEEEAKADEEGGEEEKPADPPKPDHRPRGGFQRKIERLERELAMYRGQPAAPTAPAAPAKELTADEKAAEWLDQRVNQMLEQREAHRRQQEEMAKFQERTAEVRARHPDFDEVLADVSHIPVPKHVNEALLTSDVGPEIMYSLASNPAELARISALPPLAAAREIGRLEAKASGAAPQSPKPRSAARPPPPPSKVGGSSVSSTRSLEDLPISEYKRLYRTGKR